MSDAFADLWETPAPKKHNIVSAPISQAGSRPLTPAQASISSADPFGSLLSGSFSNSGSNGKMTMAEMAKKVEIDRMAKLGMNGNGLSAANTNPSSSNTVWDGLDTLGGARGTGIPQGPSKTTSLLDGDDDWAFSTTSVPAVVSTQAVTQETSSANDFDLLSQSPTIYKASTNEKQSVWDALDSFNEPPKPAEDPLDEWRFSTAPSKPAQARSPALASRSDSPSNDFDFGDDDVFSTKRNQTNAPTRSAAPSTRVPSPPPHIMGQLVEMGFTPAKARSALISIYTPQPEPTSGSASERRKARDAGWNVESAIALLLSSAGTEGASHATPVLDAEELDGFEPPRRSRPPPRSRPSERAPPSNGDDLQSQGSNSSDLLSQASEIGLSVFNRANAFWNTKGKEMKEKMVERVVKVYEDTTGGGEGSGSRGGSRTASAAGRTKPKWMQDDALNSPPTAKVDFGSTFRDDDVNHPPFAEETARPRRQDNSAPPPRDSKVDLFSTADAPAAYVSPFRRGRPKQDPAAPSLAGAPSTVNVPTVSQPPSPPKPKPKPRASLVTCAPDVLGRSAAAKEAGTAAFKLGQYADAANEYSRAIDALPSGHLGRVPLYNNRALVRMRNGEVRAAVEDAERAVNIICGVGDKASGSSSSGGDLGSLGFDELAGPTKSTTTFTASPLYDPSTEIPPSRPEDGGGVDLATSWSKAVRRRAEGLEALEKWSAALAEWEILLNAGAWVHKGTRDDAVKGVTRCRSMAGGRQSSGSAASSSPAPKPKPKPAAPRRPPAAAASSKPSEGVTALRAAASQAESDAAAAHALKDTIDAKLTAWKGGKETNIRALIASLDTVLWEEVGWKKVGMGELVSPGQVKVRYVRAIAKVHPDKLNPANSTLEQRMIANGVFGALNEAWNAFRQ